MLRNLRSFGALALLLPFAVAGNDFGAALAQGAPASPAAQEIVPLYSSGHRSLAMLTLGDGPPAPVIFDTGTDENILNASYVERLRLKAVGESLLVDAATGARTSVPVVQLPNPRLSGVALTGARAQSLDRGQPDVVGVFGPGSFAGRLVTLELDKGRLRVAPMRPPKAAPTPYANGLPAVAIDVAGLPVIAHIDSGSDGALSLGRALMDKVPLKTRPRVVATAVSALGSQDIYAAQIDGDVQVGPLRLHDPEVEFIGTGNGGNIGYQLLRKLTLVLDPAGKRSWVLDPSDGPGPLSAYTGQFGPRSIRVENGRLVHQREGRPAFALDYRGADLFEMPATGDLVQFYRKDGKVVSLELITAEGDVVPADRTS
jgi:hypothetical protein